MASMQRTWRRNWAGKKISWYSTAKVYSLRKRRTARQKQTLKPAGQMASPAWQKQVAAGVAALQLLSIGTESVAFASNITIDGRTATQIATNGNVTDIHTDTFRGQNAFNSFKNFNVANGEIVNLHFSNLSGTLMATNLLNYVSGGQSSTIDGMLNGIRNGQIGGNVFLINPYGVMVSKTGVVNVGTLTAVTPSPGQMNDFLDNTLNGAKGTDAYWQSFDPAGWARVVPLSDDGSIVVQGKINAANGAFLRAHDVSNTGVIASAASFQAKDTIAFSDVVNTNGIASGTRLAVDGGVIEIVADNNIVNAGQIVNEGAAGQKGGVVKMKAGNDITLTAASTVSVKGSGQNSDGGSVKIVAANNALIGQNALVDASGGSSGNGGAIEFSGSKNVDIQGGLFKAGAVNGKGGSVLIDPENISWTGSGSDVFNNDGASYTLDADDSITLNDVVISTRKVATTDATRANIETAASRGNSGDITLTAKHITLGDGTKLLANADNSFTGGAVKIEASDTATINYMGYKEASASIQIGDANGGATIKGASVDLHAVASAENEYILPDVGVVGNAVSIATTTVSTLPQWLQSVGVDATYSAAKTSAVISVKSGSKIVADKDVTMKAETVASAGSRPLSIPSLPLSVSIPASAGVAYATIDATAKVEMEKGASVSAENLTVRAHNDATMDMALEVESSSDSKKLPDFAVALAISDTKVDATANIGGVLNVSGDVQVAATNTGSYSTASDSSTDGKGVAAAAVAVAQRTTNATASLTADVPDATKVGVFAVNNISGDSTEASTKTGQTTTDVIMGKTEQVTSVVSDSLENTIVGFIDTALAASSPAGKAAKPKQQTFRLSGAVAYADNSDTASATIGGGTVPQVVHASDSVAVGSQVKAEDISIAASAAAVSDSGKKVSGNTTKESYSAGVAYGNFDHTALANIGSNITVTAGKIGVASQTIIPIRDADLFSGSAFDQSTALSTLTSSLEGLTNLTDVFNGQSSAKSTTDESSGSIGVSGSASILTFSNTSQAVVDAGAKLNLLGDGDGKAWQSDAIALDEGSDAKSILGVTYKDKVDPTTAQFTFDKQATVKATNDATLLFLGGAVLPNTSSGQTGLGMVLNYVTVNSDVKAVVREGANIQKVTDSTSGTVAGERNWTQVDAGTAASVQVAADNQDKVISIVSSSGVGSTFGLNGSVAVTALNEKTYALVDDEATVKAKDLDVTATASPVDWSVSGGINLSKGASVGIGIAYNDVTGDTQAAIADNDTLATTGTSRSSQLSIADAVITTADLDVEAHTGGYIGAIAVTPSIANSSDSSGGFLDSVKTQYDKVKQLAAKVVGEKGKSVSGGSSTKPASPSFGLAGAGSGAVNTTSLQNSALIDGVHIVQEKPATGTASLAVRGTTDSTILAAAGAAAITRANSSSQKVKAGVTGSVAVNMTGNGNSAVLSNSTVDNAGDVSVQALSSGDQVAVGIGVGADLSQQGADFTFSANGSVSLTLDQTDSNGNAKNNTKALVKNTKINGDTTASGRDVKVTAYNSTTVGTGGGSLEIQPLSSDATGAGVGAAVTYANVQRDVVSEVSNSTIQDVDTVAVNAVNAGKIAAAGAVGSITNDPNTVMLAGAVVISEINNHTTASVDNKSSLTATTDVAVTAKNSLKDSELEKLIDTKARAAENLNYNALGTLSGDGIISVAGVVQAGKGPNAGVSVNYSEISDKLAANVADSNVTVTGVDGKIDVSATSDAAIWGMAIGVGAATENLSIGGSVAISEINNSVTTFVGQSDKDGSATSLKAGKVTVESTDSSTIRTLAGQVNVSAGENPAAGGAIAFNEITNEASAVVHQASITAPSVSVAGYNASEIDSIAAAGAISTSGPAALAGSVTVNLITDTTEGVVDKNSVIDASGSAATDKIAVIAKDSSKINSLAGTLAASGGEAAAGGALSYNTVKNTNTAKVADSSVLHAAALAVNATEKATINTLAAAAAGAQSAALSGSAVYAGISNTTTAELVSATVSGDATMPTDVAVKAGDTSSIRSVAGGAAFSGGASIGGAIAVNTITNIVQGSVSGTAAQKSDLTNTGGLAVEGVNDATIYSGSISGAGGSDLAAAGSASTNIITNTTDAVVENASVDGTTADLAVKAEDGATIDSAAGSIAGSGTVSLGAATSGNNITNHTTGAMHNVTANVKSVNVSSAENSAINSAALGGGGSGTVAANFSITTNLTRNTTNAVIDGTATAAPLSTNITANTVAVDADNSAHIYSLSGAAGGSGNAAVGAAAAYSDISDATQAQLNYSTVNAGQTTAVTADNKADIKTISIGFAGAGEGAAVQGTAASGRVANTTEATVVGTNMTNANDRVLVQGTSNSSIFSEALVATVGGIGAGVGAAVTVNLIDTDAIAKVSGGSYTVKNLDVEAVSNNSIIGEAIGGSVGGVGAGVQGSVAVNMITTDTTAAIDSGAQVTALDNAGVIATTDDQVTNITGTLAIGGLGAGVGVAMAVNEIGGNTSATISGTSTAVSAAGGNTNDTLAVSDGLSADAYGDAVVASAASLYGLNSKRQTKQVTGVAVNASATHTISSGVANASGGAFAGVAGTGNVNLVDGATTASIDKAKINQGGTPADVTVRAEDYALNFGFAGALGAGAAGVGGATDTNKFTRNVSSSVTGEGKTTDAVKAKALSVTAASRQGASSFADGVGVGSAGIGGTASVGLYQGTTEASVKEAKVDVDSMQVDAEHESRLFLHDGGVGVGYVGVGAAVGVSLDANITQALVENSTVSTNGSVTVQAVNTATFSNVTASGAVGAAGVALGSSVSVNVLGDIADAHVLDTDIGGSSARAGDVTVKAENNIDLDNVTGSVSAGSLSAGASVAVNRINDTTTAYIGGSKVYAANVAVEANADRHIDTDVMMGAVGEVALNGNVAVTTIGSDLNDDAKAQSQSTIDDAYRLASSDKIGTAQQDQNGGTARESDVSKLMGAVGQKDKLASLNTKAQTDIAAKQAAMTSKTYAGVTSASTVDATGDVAVKALETDAITSRAGTVAVGVVSVGGAVDVLTVKHNVEAIMEASTVKAVNVGVTALTQGASSNLAFQGSAGGINITATVAVSDVTANTTAKAAGSITASGNIAVLSQDTSAVTAEAMGAQAGAINLQAVVASAKKDGDNQALVGGTVDMDGGSAGTLTVDAERSGSVQATSTASMGGAYGANAAAATATDQGAVVAQTNDNSTIQADNDAVSVKANASDNVKAKSIGVGVSSHAQIGASVATTTVKPTVTAGLGVGNNVKAASLAVQAAGNVTTSAQANASGGGLLLGLNAAVTTVKSEATVIGAIGDGSSLTVTGDVAVEATANTAQTADASGITGGILAVGINRSEADSNSNINASVGKNVVVNASKVNVAANGQESNDANVITGAGGAIAGSGALAKTNTGGMTKASLGDGASVTADRVAVTAEHTALFNGKIDNLAASLVGASGVDVSHTVDTDVLTSVNGTVAANDDSSTTDKDVVTLKAVNNTKQNWLGSASNGDDAGWNIRSASGGALNASAVAETDAITQTANVTVGSQANITAGSASAAGSFAADAQNNITAHNKAKINAGGAISVAEADSTVNTVADAGVTFATGAKVNSKNGSVKAGAVGNADLDSRVAVDVYGAAGAPIGKAHVAYTGNNKIVVGNGARLTTDSGDIVLAAGQNTDRMAGTINDNAAVNLWNKTAFPINSKPDPKADIVNNASVELQAGSYLGSAEDIYLTADKGTMNASYTGIGKDLYREAAGAIASGISNLFGGGDVNFDVKGGSSSTGGAATATVNGNVETGTHRTQSLTIGGKYVTQSDYSQKWVADITATDGITYDPQYAQAISSKMTDRLNELYALKGEYAGDKTACDAYDAEIRFLQNKMVSMGLAAWSADGKTFIPGTSAGSGAVSEQAAAKAARTAMETRQTQLGTAVPAAKATYDTAQAVADLVSKRDTAGTELANAQSALNSDSAGLPSGATVPTNTTEAETAYKAAAAADQAAYQKVWDDYKAIDTANKTIGDCKADIVKYKDGNGVSYSGDVSAATVAAPLATAKSAYDQLHSEQSQIGDILTNNLTDAYIAGLSNEVPTGPTADYLTVKDAEAKLGDIHVVADNLVGTGTLRAPGDASITIKNSSPDFLTVKNLTINDGGNILFNGGEVKSAADINKLNASGKDANFNTVETKANTAAPIISIESTFNPDSNKQTVYDSNGNAVGLSAVSIAPDITLAKGSTISNLNGKVTIHSAVGSIYSNGSINAGSVDITASNGDFVQSYVNGFNNVAGDPGSIYDTRTKTGQDTTGKGITANGNVFVSARYLNINGLIQSGIDEWTLTLSDTGTTVKVGNNTAATLADAQADYKSKGGSGLYVLSGGYTGNIGTEGKVVYNADKDRFEVEGVAVHGGYVQLYGQIMNTAENGASTGKVRALDGYGTINIQNNSSKDIVVKALDTGSGSAGIIDITDVRSTGTVHTVYKSDRGVLTTTVNDAVVANSNTSTVNGRTNTVYTPENGLYYNWTTGQDASKTEYYHFESNDVFGFEYSSSTVGTLTQVVYGVETRLADGNYLTRAADRFNYYSDIKETINTGASIYTKIREHTKRKWWTLGIAGTYYLDYKLVTPTKTITTKTIKASNPIGIEFFGKNEGAVDISSTNANANVLLDGSVNNKNGGISIHSANKILQNNDAALITGNTISLDAKEIGGDSAAVRVNSSASANGSVNATATDGNLNLYEVMGDLRTGVVKADMGIVKLTADGNLVNAYSASSYVEGKRVELTSHNGAIGTVGEALTVQTGYAAFDATTTDAEKASYGLQASAMGDINIANEAWSGNSNANLLVDKVSSTLGDVKLSTAGQLIDNNVDEQIDTRTWNQLTEYWDSLQLRDGQAETSAKQTQTVAGYENGKTADYQNYWLLKEHMVNGAYVLTDAEKTALGAEADTYAATQAARYTALESARIGQLNGGAYSSSYVYNATDAEKAALLKGSSWTERELAISLSPGALKQLTDTNPVIKEPNVKGNSVTLNAGKGIGSNVTLVGISTSVTPDQLTAAQKVALAAAERDDLTITDSMITVTQRKPVNIEVGTGVLNATSGSYAYLASEKTVNLDQIIAGNSEEVRLKAAGAIVNGDSSSYNLVGGNVVLESAKDGIGAAGNMLRLNIDGDLTARAEDGVYLTSDKTLKIDSIYSPGDVKVTVGTGDLLAAYADGQLNIMSDNLTLFAAGGIGSDMEGLRISLDGDLTADAHDSLYLKSQGDKLTVQHVASSNADIKVTAVNDLDVREVKAGQGSVTLSSGQDMTIGDAQAAGNSTAVAGNNLRIATMTSDAGAVILTAGKTLKTTNVTAKAGGVSMTSTGGDITAAATTAKKTVVMQVANDLQVTGSAVSDENDVTLTAGHDLNSGTVSAGQGNVKLQAGNDLMADTTTADVGDITFTAGKLLHVTDVTATAGKVDLISTGGDVTAGNVQAGTTIKAQAGGTILNAAASGANFTAQDIDLVSGQGNIGQENKKIVVEAAGHLTAQAEKDINLTDSNGDFKADQLVSNSGFVNVATAPVGGEVDVALVRTAKGMRVRGDRVTLDNVAHTDTNEVMTLDISGATAPSASRVNVQASSAVGVQFDKLIADQVVIQAVADKVELTNANVKEKADIRNNALHAVQSNVLPIDLRAGDVVYQQLGASYNLLLDGNRIITDATVLNVQSGLSLNGMANQNTATTVAENIGAHTGGIVNDGSQPTGTIVVSGEHTLSDLGAGGVGLVDLSQLAVPENAVAGDIAIGGTGGFGLATGGSPAAFVGQPMGGNGQPGATLTAAPGLPALSSDNGPQAVTQPSSLTGGNEPVTGAAGVPQGVAHQPGTASGQQNGANEQNEE